MNPPGNHKFIPSPTILPNAAPILNEGISTPAGNFQKKINFTKFSKKSISRNFLVKSISRIFFLPVGTGNVAARIDNQKVARM